ncbi:hypothetical protein EJ05DRAFT_515548 [Pseudovirgaria hyperparasitica]|uniref:Uncharacterized protein n=1 Tax=Pseudovirgaria hyperparasitica TaxID=470096 RepID=A0A6A6VR13_9PEZI|nr:uncharacterized protein EJ05DRAFT_515548 [Pseudovirgaria hyperparasitica]KAF2752575.1 hypothetical protein EJ05DRAFT_515548 [Pseudovirgaria hyperparasitica]
MPGTQEYETSAADLASIAELQMINLRNNHMTWFDICPKDNVATFRWMQHQPTIDETITLKEIAQLVEDLRESLADPEEVKRLMKEIDKKASDMFDAHRRQIGPQLEKKAIKDIIAKESRERQLIVLRKSIEDLLSDEAPEEYYVNVSEDAMSVNSQPPDVSVQQDQSIMATKLPREPEEPTLDVSMPDRPKDGNEAPSWHPLKYGPGLLHEPLERDTISRKTIKWGRARGNLYINKYGSHEAPVYRWSHIPIDLAYAKDPPEKDNICNRNNRYGEIIHPRTGKLFYTAANVKEVLGVIVQGDGCRAADLNGLDPSHPTSDWVYLIKRTHAGGHRADLVENPKLPKSPYSAA